MASLKRLKNIVGDFPKRKLLVLGDVMLDKYLMGDVERISPEAPVPVLDVTHTTETLGGAANVAHNIASVGAGVFLSGVVGSDSSGKDLLALLRSKKINTSGILTLEGRPTTTKTRIVARNQQMVRVDHERRDFLPRKAVRDLLRGIEKKVSKSDALIIEDYGKGVIEEELASQVIRHFKKNKKPVFADPKRSHFEFYRGAEVLTPNQKETEEYLGFSLKDEASIARAARELRNRLELSYSLITLGGRGMYLLDKDGGHKIPAATHEVYDVSGAGDTVISLLALSRSCGASPLEAALIANLGAAIVVGKFGVAALGRHELEQGLDEHGEALLTVAKLGK